MTKHDAKVDPAKTKGVAQRVVDRFLPWLVRYDIQGTLWIRSLVVEGRRNKIVLHSQHTHSGFDCGTSSKWVTVEGLCPADRNLCRYASEHFFYTGALIRVIESGGARMSVDIIDLIRINLCGFQRVFHGPDARVTGRQRGGHMIRIVVEAVAYHLTVNVGSACFRVLILFEDQAGRAFPHDESISIAIKRPARD